MVSSSLKIRASEGFETGANRDYMYLAGGLAITSDCKRMLDLVPEHIHDRSGIFMGSRNEVMKAKEFLAKRDSK